MKIITDEQIKEFKAFLDAHNFFYVIGHKEPDGDCIYSCLGMARLLDKLNLEYQLLNAGPFKRNEVADKAEFFSDKPAFLSEPELKKTGLIMLDCSELKRLGEMGDDLKGLDTFIVDHHLTASVTENCIIDPSSPATCCLIQQLYEKLAGPLTKEVAEYIFFGQSTDTGYFPSRKTYDKITGGKPYSTRKLLGVLLERSEKYFNDKFIITWETMEDTKKYGLEGRDSDSLYSLLLSCEGVEAVAFLRQDTEHTCTGGLRSRDDVDVSQVAAKFGGGGHKNASGFSVEGKLETLIPQVKKEFGKIL